MRNLAVSPVRIAADLEALAAITEPDRPWTRRAFSPLFDRGRDWLRNRFEQAGLAVGTDAGGNLLGIRCGSQPGRGMILLGSHSDTVPSGGRFDGIAGVVVALEVARALADRGVTLRHDLGVVDFLAEEVSVFGVSCIGSRAMAGVLPERWLDLEHDGRSLARAIADVGGDPARIAARDDIRAFLELHIEQGPVLESGWIDLGLVTAIAGITRVEIHVEGRADHAGTTPMGARIDALVAASRLVTEIEARATAQAAQGRHFTATVGEFSIQPGAANVVPSSARMLIDARAEDRADMAAFLDWLRGRGDVMGARVEVLSDNPPVPMDAGLVARLETAATAAGASHLRMVSGAGHDAAFMARLAPAAMVFVPCLGGRSHAPEEWAETDDIALGAEVLAQTVIALDQEGEN